MGVVAIDERSFGHRLAEPGVVERCELASRFGFMAYHGGELEEMTDVIAAAAAARSGASLYTVAHPGPNPAHFPSTHVRPAESPALAAFVDHVDVVVTVHGYGRWGMFTSLLLGGRNRRLADQLAAMLAPALPDFDVVTALDLIPKKLRGLHADNPVNLPRQRGVQLELPPRVRGLGPRWTDWDGAEFVPPMEAVVEGMAAIARRWPDGDGAHPAP